ncbi:MAG: hypothetical protein K2X39_04235 [Silvanigrellaceae bacterium]|nr:hypothetical protein [Silvanigrellaceae bacterium]
MYLNKKDCIQIIREYSPIFKMENEQFKKISDYINAYDSFFSKKFLMILKFCFNFYFKKNIEITTLFPNDSPVGTIPPPLKYSEIKIEHTVINHQCALYLKNITIINMCRSIELDLSAFFKEYEKILQCYKNVLLYKTQKENNMLRIELINEKDLKGIQQEAKFLVSITSDFFTQLPIYNILKTNGKKEIFNQYFFSKAYIHKSIFDVYSTKSLTYLFFKPRVPVSVFRPD